MSGQGIRLPPVGPIIDLERHVAQAEAWMAEAEAEAQRRSALTDEQWLAERLNFAFTREPGEAWYYESQRPDPWSRPEHKRWLEKARTLLEVVPDRQEALKLARTFIG